MMRTIGLLPTSLIICSRNRPALLLETVQSVLQGDEVPAELVIVDQSTAPHVALQAMKSSRGCEIRYLWSDAVGLSRGRNIGVAAARHDIIACIDDDMFVTPNWLGNLIRALIHAGEHAVVTGRVLPTEAETAGGFVPALVLDERPATYHGRIGTDVLAGGHMATYRSVFDAVGGFDERLGAGSSFPAADDNDLGFRLLEAGYRIVYVPEAVLYHRAWRSRRHYLPMRWSYGRGKGGFYTKYLSLRDRYMLRRMGWDVAHRARLFPYRLLHERYRACGDVVYVLGMLVGAVQWALTQRRIR